MVLHFITIDVNPGSALCNHTASSPCEGLVTREGECDDPELFFLTAHQLTIGRFTTSSGFGKLSYIHIPHKAAANVDTLSLDFERWHFVSKRFPKPTHSSRVPLDKISEVHDDLEGNVGETTELSSRTGDSRKEGNGWMATADNPTLTAVQ